MLLRPIWTLSLSLSPHLRVYILVLMDKSLGHGGGHGGGHSGGYSQCSQCSQRSMFVDHSQRLAMSWKA